MSDKRLFLIILVVYLVLATAVSVIVPLGEAPDEADHYAYARYLALNRTLPQGPEITQGKHPPLYHSLAALAGGWTGMPLFLQPNPDVLPIRPDGPANFFIHGEEEHFPWQGGPLAFHLARLISVLLGGVTLWATWRIGRAAFPDRAMVGLLGAAFLAGLPGFIYISGAMNNDNAAGAFGALAVLLMVLMLQKGLSWKRTLLLGVVFGLGLLSKVGTLSLWPLLALVALGIIWPEWRRWRAWVRAGIHAVAAWMLGGIIASPWLLHNWRLYGDPLGWELVRQTVDVREGPMDLSVLIWLFKGLYTYFWGRYGAIGQIQLPGWAYLLAGIFSLAVVTGVILFLVRRGKPDAKGVFVLLVLAGAPLLMLAGIVRYTAIALGTDQARLLWPGLAAMAVWFGMGLTGLFDATGLSDRIGKKGLTLGVLVASAAFGLAVLLLLVRPAFA
jgi:4-amino-4-deoxy-L-arabinose transferase-like glycosyltransferase